MKKNRKIAGIIAAGGSSSRYKDGNKLLKELDGIPVFVHCIRCLKQVCNEQCLVLVCPEKEIEVFQHALIACHEDCHVKVIAGGRDRMESVWNGLISLDKDIDLVAIHDAARPFLSLKLILDLLDCAELYGGVVPAKRVTDTIKMGNGQNLIEKTIDRNVLWSVQTPQVFKYDVLMTAYKLALKEDKRFTDEAGILEYSGQPVYLHEYSDCNIKITYEHDLVWAENFIHN